MKVEVEKNIKENKVVAIIRGFSSEICLHLAEAYLAGGIRAVEVTYVQTDHTLWAGTVAAISSIKKEFGSEMSVGAGTVLTAEQLNMTRDAGGEFMVAPNCNPEIIKAAVNQDIAAIPGAFTATEIVDAWDAGATFVKVFPAGALGPAYFKALRAPLAHIPMLAVAGVTLENAAEFIKVGCSGIAVSGPLTKKEYIEAGAWDKITAVARDYVERVKI